MGTFFSGQQSSQLQSFFYTKAVEIPAYRPVAVKYAQTAV